MAWRIRISAGAFEKAPALRTGGYMIDFWGMGYDIAEKMGVLPAIKEKGYKIEKLKIVGDEGEEKAHLDIQAMSSVVDNRFTSVARSDVSKALYDACGDIETHFGKHITAVEQTKIALWSSFPTAPEKNSIW
ncbi:MAG: hypothetical protein R3B51_10470 [Thermodesulfobacteriota bacterium]